MIKAEPEKLVGEEIQMPELHLLIGVSNHYYKKLKLVWPSLVLWARCTWTVHGRQGGGLDGANSSRLGKFVLLTSIFVSFLKKLELLRKVVPPAAIPIIDTLQLFRAVQTGCFGWDLCQDYRERIQAFTESVKNLQVYFKVRNPLYTLIV